MVLGITGNIASGKSTVAKWFAEFGAKVVSADQLAREVVAPGSEVLRDIVRRFGADILTGSGELDREQLGRIIFADSGARHDLNRIVHPALARLAETRLHELRQAGHPLIVYEAPLLFEAGARQRVDRVLVVTVTEEEQIRRLRQRDGIDALEARRRMAAQMPQAEKASQADFLIDNSGSLDACREQVRQLAGKLLSPSPDSPETH